MSGNPSQSSSSQPPLVRTVDLQPIEDFLRENPAPAPAQHHAQQQPKKQKNKTAPDEDVVAAEKEAIAELGEGVNWVGRLQEYRFANPLHSQPPTISPLVPPLPLEVIYTESAITHHLLPRFLFSVRIAEHPTPFSSTISFSTKKTAKQYAAKLAVDWLIANGHMPADGSVKFPKSAPSVPSSSGALIAGPSARGNGNGNGDGEVSTIASQVPQLCHRLGLQPPRYVLEKVAGTDNLWDIYASFGGDPRFKPRVGEVQGVYGKAHAKFCCAVEVLEVLREVERRRMGGLERDGRDGSGKGKKEEDDDNEVFYDA